MVEIQEGVIIKTSEGSFLVVNIDHFDERGHYFKYILVNTSDFSVEGWYLDYDEIQSSLDILDAFIVDKKYLH